jgi:serine/threonine-protein kinase
VEGENVKSLIERRGLLEAAEAAAILKDTLRGLAHIHAGGYVHRDIKSENILISREQQVKITDFGIAKSLTGDGFKTMQEIIMGTPAYLAPEQVRGEPPTPASDLYSLGIVLYEMLTGAVPFQGDSAARILMRHINDPVPDPAATGVEVPRGVVALLRRLLEKQPADRFASAPEVLAEVERQFPDAQTPAAAVAASASGKHATVTVAPAPAAGGTVRTSRKSAPAAAGPSSTPTL